MKETIGQRLFKIRSAWGDGRDPETLDDFAARVKKKTGVSYNPVTLSLLERMKRKWRVADVEAFAAVDKLNRGRAWLAGWDIAAAERPPVGTRHPNPRDGNPSTASRKAEGA